MIFVAVIAASGGLLFGYDLVRKRVLEECLPELGSLPQSGTCGKHSTFWAPLRCVEPSLQQVLVSAPSLPHQQNISSTGAA